MVHKQDVLETFSEYCAYKYESLCKLRSLETEYATVTDKKLPHRKLTWIASAISEQHCGLQIHEQQSRNRQVIIFNWVVQLATLAKGWDASVTISVLREKFEVFMVESNK